MTRRKKRLRHPFQAFSARLKRSAYNLGWNDALEVSRAVVRAAGRREIPPDLVSILRDPSVIVSQDVDVWERIAEWNKAPSNTATAEIREPGKDRFANG